MLGHCFSGRNYICHIHEFLISIIPVSDLSSCGYDVNAQQARDSHKLQNAEVRKAEWTCQVPYMYTECLAHVEVVEQVSNGEIMCISGVLEHNQGCCGAMLEQLPAIPLHDHVYGIALEQLKNGAR